MPDHSSSGQRPAPLLPPPWEAGSWRSPDPRCAGDPDRAGRDPAGDREGRDRRAGALRPRLRDLHPAAAGSGHRHRAVPQAAGHRARVHDIEDIWHAGRQLLLAERTGAQQRPVRGRHGALGHQGQAGGDAALPAARRRCRVAATVYVHASGRDPGGRRRARRFMEQGFAISAARSRCRAPRPMASPAR